MITDGYGLIVERRSYDTWGKQRKVIWKDNDPLTVAQEAITNRGYTGHEEISEIGLIHMNGRVYDQELARFISPDPHIQSPFLTNSFNRYAYVVNNPLKYNDPTGFLFTSGGMDVGGGRDPLGRGEHGGPDRAPNDSRPQGPIGSNKHGPDPDHYGGRTDNVKDTGIITNSGAIINLKYNPDGSFNYSVVDRISTNWNSGFFFNNSYYNTDLDDQYRSAYLPNKPPLGFFGGLSWESIDRAISPLAPSQEKLSGYSEALNNTSLISGDLAYAALMVGNFPAAAALSTVSFSTGIASLGVNLATGDYDS